MPIEKVCGADVAPVLSFTVTLKVDVPTLTGMPLITPVEGTIPRPAKPATPAGSDPLLIVQPL